MEPKLELATLIADINSIETSLTELHENAKIWYKVILRKTTKSQTLTNLRSLQRYGTFIFGGTFEDNDIIQPKTVGTFKIDVVRKSYDDKFLTACYLLYRLSNEFPSNNKLIIPKNINDQEINNLSTSKEKIDGALENIKNMLDKYKKLIDETKKHVPPF